jgi:hypothetical protein
VSDNPLVGIWRLMSFEMRNEQGRVRHPLGPDAVGFITYAPDGHMAVQFGLANGAPSWPPAIWQGEATAGNGGVAYAVPTAVNGGSELLIFVVLRASDPGLWASTRAHGAYTATRKPAMYVASESRPKPSQSARHRRATSAAANTGSPANRFPSSRTCRQPK